jgi:hypothetical protein
MKEATLGNLKIQVFFKHGKWDRNIKETKQRKFKPEDEVKKIGQPSGLKFQTIQFEILNHPV